MKHYINVIQINSVSVHSLYFDPPPTATLVTFLKASLFKGSHMYIRIRVDHDICTADYKVETVKTAFHWT